MERADDVYIRNFEGKGEDRVRGPDRIVCLCFGGSLDGQYVEIPAEHDNLIAGISGKIRQLGPMTYDEISEFASGAAYNYNLQYLDGPHRRFAIMVEKHFSLDDVIQELIRVYSWAMGEPKPKFSGRDR